MSSHDYYNSAYQQPAPYHDPVYDNYNRRNDALPPVPNEPEYEDRAYPPYSHQAPSQSYTGSSGRLHDNADPFEDQNAIQMRRPKHESATTISPILSVAEDPFVRDADPNRRRRAGSEKKKGWFSGRVPWVVYTLSLVQLIVFLAEFIKMGVLTGTPIEIHPSFNPMLGPSPYVLINFGARYQPCMHNMPGIQNSTGPIAWPCPNATATTGDSVSCSLSDLCGFGGANIVNPVPGGSIHDHPAPNQWWRFIVPIFIHAGIIHITFNLLLQLTLGKDMERLIGSVRFAIVYFAAGIFGFVLGGNFAADGIASCGASGSLFGMIALMLLDLLYNWNDRRSPIKDLLFIILDIIVAFALGLLPGLDNFSHIGGFLMGLVLGVCILRSPTAFARRTSSVGENRYSGLSHRRRSSSGREEGIRGFIKQPLGFFQNRRGVWWAWWLVRAAALIGCFVGFILLLENFYKEPMIGCRWCKYLSCLPVTVGGTNWCEVGSLSFTNQTSKRDVSDLMGRDVFALGGYVS